MNALLLVLLIFQSLFGNILETDGSSTLSMLQNALMSHYHFREKDAIEALESSN
jgi:hypothetical protein